MRGAPETVGLQQKDVKADSTYLSIDPSRDPVTPGALTLRASVSSEFGSGSITFAGDGTIKRIDSATDLTVGDVRTASNRFVGAEYIGAILLARGVGPP